MRRVRVIGYYVLITLGLLAGLGACALHVWAVGIGPY